jgi:hypothetical protein
LGFGLWALGFGLWALGFGLWALGFWDFGDANVYPMSGLVTRALMVLLPVLALSAAPTEAQRLPDNAVPEHYTLSFAPDFATDTFVGTASIRVRLKRPSPTITLHAAEIEFKRTNVTSGRQTQTAAVTLDPDTEFATITVPKPLPAGLAIIDIEFKGVLNDKLRGFYLSKANGRKYAVTQLEATDARRAFPSFDEPIYKATFDISLTIDAADIAISNGELLSDTPGPGAGKHTLKFSRTAKMSSYLVAMLVGDFTCRSGAVGDIPVRVCATPDKQGLTSASSTRFARSTSSASPTSRRVRWRTPVPLRSASDRCWPIRRARRSPSVRTSRRSSPTSSPINGSATW